VRHTLVDQRGEWQQRIHAVLYHHGCPHHHGIGLLTAKGRAWLDGLGLPSTALEQVTVAVGMIDALDVQLAPIDKQLRAYARRQPGCKAPIGHYGIGHLTAVTILAELGDARRFSSSREAVRYSGLDITVKQSDKRRAPGHLSRQGTARPAPGAPRGRPIGPPAEQPRPRLLPPGGRETRRQPRPPRGRAQAAQAQPPHPARTRRPGAATRPTPRPARAALTQPDVPRPAPGIVPPPRPRGRPPTTERPQSFTERDHPINHHLAGPPHGTVVDRDTAGAPARTTTPETAKRAARRPRPR
jgi:hypothetical protein